MADELIDLAVFNELQDNVGADFVFELVDTFLEEAPAMIGELRTALAAGDPDSFRRAAHSLKTNAHTFGASALGAKALELEKGDLPGDPKGLDALDVAYAEATAALKALKNG